MTMKVFGMVAAAVLWTGQAMAASSEIRVGELRGVSRVQTSTSPWLDEDVNLNLDTPTAGSKGFAVRVGVTDMRRTTGDTTTSYRASAFNETVTRIIDSSTPVRGLRVWLTPSLAGASHFVSAVGAHAMVGLSVYGKTAATLRQGYIPVMIGEPIVLDNIFWYNTTGASVSLWTELSSADANAATTLHVQVLR